MKEKLKFMYDHMEEIILAPGFAVMLVINFANVLSRFVLHNAWAFTEELCTILFVYITFFGAAVAVKRRQHLGFTLVLEKLPPVGRMIMHTVILLLTDGFLVIMIKFGSIVVRNQLASGATTAALRIPTAWGNVCIPIAGVFIILRGLEVYIADIKAELAEIRKRKEAKA